MLGVGISLRHLRGSTAVDAYKVGVYSPKLVFDFDEEYYRTNGEKTTFDDALTFTRSGSATYVDSTGTLQTAADGEPRLGHHVYENGQWVNKGLLLETEARTNLLAYSSNLADPYYNKTSISGNEVSIISGRNDPWGGTSAAKIQERDADDFHRTWRFNVQSSGDGCFWGIFKAAGRGWINLRISGDNEARVSFDLTNGVVGSDNGAGDLVDYGIEDWGNGWYLCWLSSSAAKHAFVYLSDEDSAPTEASEPSYIGDGESGVDVAHLQFEAALTPSSIIPTNGSTVTRAAETLTIPSANLPYSSTAMSIAMEGTVTYAADGQLSRQLEWSLNADNRIILQIAHNSGEQEFFQEESVYAPGVFVRSATSTYSPGVNVPFNIASRHGSTSINGAVDGTALTANTTPTALPDLSSTDLDLGETFMGTISQFRMWDIDLGNDGIESASS